MASIESLPIVDLAKYIESPESPEGIATSKAIVDCLIKTSCLIVRDPRTTFEDNDVFINTMEKYYNQPDEIKKKDARPEFHYQVGATPEGTEVPKDHEKTISNFQDQYKAVKPKGADPKWRFFWRAGGEPPADTEFPALNMPQVIPEGFPEWESVMNRWSSLLLQAVHTVAELAAIGLGLEKNTITNMMKHAPHLLAPTGSNLGKHNQLGTALAGFHYDLNLFTIHGASRFPGLNIWLRDGSKVPVRVPKGCLLLQAGKQLEYITGGLITAGFHEVVVNEDTLKACEAAKEQGRPLWRVSSTLFSHVASDQILKPLKDEWNTPDAQIMYPPIKSGHQVQNELKSINLAMK